MKDSKKLFYFVEKITQPIIEKKGIYFIKLIEDWQIIMPNEFKNGTSPYKIVWNKNNQGIIYIKSDNYVINNVIMHKSQEIMQKINSYFGYNCIVQLKFIT